MFDELKTAYEKIVGRFPPGTQVWVDHEACYGTYGRNGELKEKCEFDIGAKTASGESFFEFNVDLSDIDAAAESLLRQIRRAAKAGPVRRGVNQVA